MKRTKRHVSIDTETFLIRPGLIAPPLVCVSYAERINGIIQDGLLDHVDGIAFLRMLLEDEDVVLVFHNGPYDLAVIAAECPALITLIFRALAANRIADTQTREQLIMIARGDMGFQNVEIAEDESEDDEGDLEDESESAGWKRIKKRYTLDALSIHYLRRALDKADDGWRLRYRELKGIPIAQWPERAVAYAKGDAVATLEVFEAQAPTVDDDGLTPELDRFVSPDERMQVCAAFALHLCACHGMRTDAEAIDVLETRLLSIQRGLGTKLLKAGLIREKREKGIKKFARSMKLIRALVVDECNRRELPIPLTKKGLELTAAGQPIDHGKHVSTSKDTLESVASFPYDERVSLDDRSSWLAGLEVAHRDQKDHRDETIAGLEADAFELLRQQKPAYGLEPLVTYANCQKVLGTYLKPMQLGICLPMNSRPNVLVETGRTSWSAMNLEINRADYE